MKKRISLTVRYSQETLIEEREKFKKEYEEFCNDRMNEREESYCLMSGKVKHVTEEHWSQIQVRKKKDN